MSGSIKYFIGVWVTMYDLIIKNGRIVDGTGQPAYLGDVAVKNGIIVRLGSVKEEAKEIIDAEGNLIAPGWVDTHSHMDGQATWDPFCSPANHHGITTLVMGNCGIGFAPCKPTDEAHQQLIEVVEDVEDIPGAALAEGIQWHWESFPEYLDVLDSIPRAVNVAAQAGEAIRRKAEALKGGRGRGRRPLCQRRRCRQGGRGGVRSVALWHRCRGCCQSMDDL